MTITKFDHTSVPAFIRVADFITGVTGYWVTVAFNEYRLFDGDYILQDDNGLPTNYIPSAQYAIDLVAQNLVREAIGKELIRSIWAALRAALIPDAQKGGIVTTISPVMVMILTGEIVSGRALASSIATNANYSAGVKTQLLALMDASIAKL